MACFRLNTTYQIPSFCLNIIKEKTSEKSLISVKMRHIKFHFYAQLSYTKIYYLRKKETHLVKDAAFLHFYLREISKNMLFPWNENIWKLNKIWSFLSFSQIFIFINWSTSKKGKAESTLFLPNGFEH